MRKRWSIWFILMSTTWPQACPLYDEVYFISFFRPQSTRKYQCQFSKGTQVERVRKTRNPNIMFVDYKSLTLVLGLLGTLDFVAGSSWEKVELIGRIDATLLFWSQYWKKKLYYCYCLLLKFAVPPSNSLNQNNKPQHVAETGRWFQIWYSPYVKQIMTNTLLSFILVPFFLSFQTALGMNGNPGDLLAHLLAHLPPSLDGGLAAFHSSPVITPAWAQTGPRSGIVTLIVHQVCYHHTILYQEKLYLKFEGSQRCSVLLGLLVKCNCWHWPPTHTVNE